MSQAGLQHRWFPIGALHDLPAGHVFETELLGRELAVWRGQSGGINIWENRCPHRGLRLTLGANLGGELRCAYHGYRFADQTGVCTAVPAQPERMAPRSLCAKSYPVLEREGLVWTRLAGPDPLPPSAVAAATLVLYSLAVDAPAGVVGSLLADYRFLPFNALGQSAGHGVVCSTAAVDDYTFYTIATFDQLTSEARLYLRPVDAQCTVIHGVLVEAAVGARALPLLRHHAANFTALRAVAEGLFQQSRTDAADDPSGRIT